MTGRQDGAGSPGWPPAAATRTSVGPGTVFTAEVTRVKTVAQVDFAGLKGVDGLGQLAGAPGAAAELTHNAPGLELSVGAFTRGAEPGMSPVGVLLGSGLVPSPVRRAEAVLAEIPLVGQDDQPASVQLGDDAPDPGRGQVMHRAGQRPGHPHDLAAWTGDDLQVHPMPTVLAGVEGPVRGDPVDRDQGAVDDQVRVPGLAGRP